MEERKERSIDLSLYKDEARIVMTKPMQGIGYRSCRVKGAIRTGEAPQLDGYVIAEPLDDIVPIGGGMFSLRAKEFVYILVLEERDDIRRHRREARAAVNQYPVQLDCVHLSDYPNGMLLTKMEGDRKQRKGLPLQDIASNKPMMFLHADGAIEQLKAPRRIWRKPDGAILLEFNDGLAVRVEHADINVAIMQLMHRARERIKEELRKE